MGGTPASYVRPRMERDCIQLEGINATEWNISMLQSFYNTGIIREGNVC